MADIVPWVEALIREKKGILARCGKERGRHAVKGFLAAPDKLPPFHISCLSILHAIADLPTAAIDWNNVEWHAASGFNIPIEVPLASAEDGSGLTKLVIFAHLAQIRIDIVPYSPLGVMITFKNRKQEGFFNRQHPDFKSASRAIIAENKQLVEQLSQWSSTP